MMRKSIYTLLSIVLWILDIVLQVSSIDTPSNIEPSHLHSFFFALALTQLSHTMKGFIQATISLALAALVRGSPLALNQTLTDNDDMHALEVRGDLDAVDIMFTGMQYCGIYANAEGDRITLLSTALGKGDLKNNAYNIPAGGCNRVQCYDTSGIYVCNVCLCLFSSVYICVCVFLC